MASGGSRPVANCQRERETGCVNLSAITAAEKVIALARTK